MPPRCSHYDGQEVCPDCRRLICPDCYRVMAERGYIGGIRRG